MTFAVMVKIAPIDDPSKVIEVSHAAWRRYPKAKGTEYRILRGKVLYREVTDNDTDAAPVVRQRPQVPPEVTRITAQTDAEAEVKNDEADAAPAPKRGRPRKQ